MSAFFDDLERELRRATVRRAAAQRAARVAQLRRAPIAATVAAVLLLAASAVAAVVALRPHDTSVPSAPATSPGRTVPAATVPLEAPLTSERPAEPALSEILGVLRRPQREGERDRDLLDQMGRLLPPRLDPGNPLPGIGPGGVVRLPSIRLAAAGAWGELWLVPFRPGPRDADGRPQRDRAERIAVATLVGRRGRPGGYGGAYDIAPAADGLGQEGWVGGISSGRRAITAAIVPDGVAQVGFTMRDRAGRSGERYHIVPVRDNAAVLLRARSRVTTYPQRVTWLDADGRTIVRFTPRP